MHALSPKPQIKQYGDMWNIHTSATMSHLLKEHYPTVLHSIRMHTFCYLYTEPWSTQYKIYPAYNNAILSILSASTHTAHTLCTCPTPSDH